MTKYVYLIAAILAEVGGTMLLPATQNFTRLVPTVSLSLLYGLSFWFPTFAIRDLPLGVVYATWSGLGVFSVAVLSYYFYEQALPWQGVLGLFLIVAGVALVNLFSQVH